MAVTVTEEMRRAVYEEDCRRNGHLVSYDNAMLFEVGTEGARVAGPDGKQAHITCRRCGKVWLIVEEAADNYQAATVALDLKLLPQFRPARIGLNLPNLPNLPKL